MTKIFLGVLIFGFMATAFTGCKEPSEPSILNIKYQMIGSADSVDITFRNESGELIERNNASPPWDYLFQAEAGDTVFISGHNLGGTGSVCVRIWREGEIFHSSTCTGAQCTANAGGAL